jgi:hypothetical protein
MTYSSRPQTPHQPGVDGQPPAAESATRPPRRRAGVLVSVVVAILVVIAATVGAYVKLSGGGDELEVAKQRCASADATVTVADGGKTLELSLPAGAGKGRLLGCVLDTLRAPVAVRQRIGAAKDTDDRQVGEWDRYKATWSAGGGVLSLTIEFA